MELCEHLNPVLEHELERGNTVRGSETGWSKVDLLVFMNERLNVDLAKAYTSHTVTYMRNTDPHYGFGDTMACTACRCGLAGPWVEAAAPA